MTTPARTRLEGGGPAPIPTEGPSPPAHPLLELQRAAGNAAVAGLLQRKTTLVRGPDTHVDAVEFTVGRDVALTLATKAQQMAAGGITDAELRTLRAEALGDDTINDDERMFLAGLLDAANARTVAAAKIAPGEKLTFSRATIEASMARARDIDQAAKDPAIAAERAKAAAAGSWGAGMGHEWAATKAVFAQVTQLVGPTWATRALDAFDYAIGKVPIDEVLEAMLAAASDDTPGDRTMAAIVYVVAAAAGHPMAPMIRAGKIQVDQVASLPGGDWAGYRATAGGHDAAKGDTVMVPKGLDVTNAGHRSVVIHELTHAAQDAGVTGPRVQDLDRERAEMEAYRAGARYQLEQIAPLQMIPRFIAVRDVGTLLNQISMMALMLESRAHPKEYEPIVFEANRWFVQRVPERGLQRALQASDIQIERAMYDAIGRAYGTRDANTGARIPGANVLPADALRGESILDWIDRA